MIVQIENELGPGNLEAIAAVDSVDGLFIGPADLHASLGYPGEIGHPKVLSLIDEAVGRITRAGKAAGVFAPVEEHARRWIGMGASIVALGSDIGILARGAEALLIRFRDAKPS